MSYDIEAFHDLFTREDEADYLDWLWSRDGLPEEPLPTAEEVQQMYEALAVEHGLPEDDREVPF